MLPTLRDLRHALRTLRRSPGFTFTAILSLALGLGLTTTAFAVIDAVRHPHSLIPASEQIVTLFLRRELPGERVSDFEIYDQLHGRSGALRDVSVVGFGRATIRAGGAAEDCMIAPVGRDFFRMLGVRPILGGVFANDARTAQEAGIVVSERLWRRLFPSREGVDGAVVTIDARSYPVVGVMPRGFSFPWQQDAWLLRPERDLSARGAGVGIVFGRLRPGATVEQARVELATIAPRIVQLRVGERPPQAIVDRLLTSTGRIGTMHVALLGAALAVLLIACANVANLTLARGLSRRRELAIYLALGATRRGLVRHLMAESAIVVGAGMTLGILATLWSGDLLVALVPSDAPSLAGIAPRLSWRVFAACAMTTTLVGVATGLLPALRASDATLEGALRDGAGTTTTRSHARYTSLVVAEVALALALLMAAGLLVRTARNLGLHDFGYDADGLVTSTIHLPRSQRGDAALTERLTADLVERAARLPGARSAAAFVWQGLEGNALRGDHRRGIPIMTAARVTPGFLRTLGVPMVEGRDFLAGDAAGDGAVILDERAARLLWPQESAVGHMVTLGSSNDAPWLRVVGVVRSFELSFRERPDDEPMPMVLVTGGTPVTGARRIVVRGDGGPAGARMSSRLRLDLQAAVPGGTATEAQPWLLGFEQVQRFRAFLSVLFASLGAVALTLAAIGQYGVLAYAVGQRRREFGVRLALGARPADVFRLVMREGFVLLLAGTAAGAFLAMWTASILENWLYGVPPTDVWSLVVAEGVLALASLAACVLPALRATRANPVDVLRAA